MCKNGTINKSFIITSQSLKDFNMNDEKDTLVGFLFWRQCQLHAFQNY